MKADTNELLIWGKVKRFSNSPNEQCLRLVDGKVAWILDKLLGDFENDTVCISVKRIKRKCGDKDNV